MKFYKLAELKDLDNAEVHGITRVFLNIIYLMQFVMPCIVAYQLGRVVAADAADEYDNTVAFREGYDKGAEDRQEQLLREGEQAYNDGFREGARSSIATA